MDSDSTGRPRSPSSEANREHLDKKFRASSSSPPPPRKVCAVCISSTALHHEYNIFIVDLNSDVGVDNEFNFTAMDPTIRLDRACLYGASFCVLGSTLYAVEGYSRKYNPQGGKSLFSYELPPDDSLVSNLKLEKGMLVEAPAMNHVKISPVATPTPDGKLLVFSAAIMIHSPNKCDFELYDLDERKWHKLPALRPRGRLDSRFDSRFVFWIQSFTFIEESVLFLQTEIGIFTLDIKWPYSRRRWKKLDGFCGAPRIPDNSFLIIGKDICLMPFCAYDIDVGGIEEHEDAFCRWFYNFPEFLTFPIADYSHPAHYITLLDNDNARNCTFCFLQIGINRKTMHPCLMLDVYSCDLMECREELIKYRQQIKEEEKDVWKRKRESFLLPGATRVKSFRFFLHAQQTDWFFPISFSSIPAAGTTSYAVCFESS